MKTAEIIGNTIDQIWQEFSGFRFCKVPPYFVSEIREDGIIFIGLNPSISNEEKEQLLKEEDRKIKYYDLNDKHKYFKKFPQIAEKIKLPWGHFDLLYIRETEQIEINRILKDKTDISFIYKQLMVTKEILDKILKSSKPLIFVVNNTLAREFLGKDRPKSFSESQAHWMDYRFIWDSELGTYLCQGHPFFFTSMLTGQRALDNGSYERLIWHIQMVKDKLKI